MGRLLLFIVFIMFFSNAALGMYGEDTAPSEKDKPYMRDKESPEDEQAEEAKPLDLGEPTPEEISQMEREKEHRRMEEDGFGGGFDDTLQEMAGDDSGDRW
ncbi:MAG: hypothetical protein WBC74_01710 [Candidatus Omnitrophota bacterium]